MAACGRMLFHLEGIPVVFPYPYIYPEQIEYMRHLKATLDGSGGHCLLEMPTGTGKTTTLLSFVLAYRAAHRGEVGKLVYCTRTVQEMDKAVEELRTVVEARAKEVRTGGVAEGGSSVAEGGSSVRGGGEHRKAQEKTIGNTPRKRSRKS